MRIENHQQNLTCEKKVGKISVRDGVLASVSQADTLDDTISVFRGGRNAFVADEFSVESSTEDLEDLPDDNAKKTLARR